MESYDIAISELKSRLDNLGLDVEQAVGETAKALATMDVELAKKIYEGDDEIDALVRECMKKDMTIDMLQNPVATDWRNLMATLKILSDMERIADHCADISHYILHLKEYGDPVDQPTGLMEMYAVMSSMVSDVLDFYKGKNSSQADLMKDKDDIVDEAFNRLIAQISEKVKSDPDHSRQYIAYVLIVKYIERMADHANNIAEWVIYREKNQL